MFILIFSKSDQLVQLEPVTPPIGSTHRWFLLCQNSEPNQTVVQSIEP